MRRCITHTKSRSFEIALGLEHAARHFPRGALTLRASKPLPSGARIRRPPWLAFLAHPRLFRPLHHRPLLQAAVKTAYVAPHAQISGSRWRRMMW